MQVIINEGTKATLINDKGWFREWTVRKDLSFDRDTRITSDYKGPAAEIVKEAVSRKTYTFMQAGVSGHVYFLQVKIADVTHSQNPYLGGDVGNLSEEIMVLEEQIGYAYEREDEKEAEDMAVAIMLRQEAVRIATKLKGEEQK